MSYTSEGLIQLGFEWEKDFCIYEDRGLVWNSDQPKPTEPDCEAAKAEYDAQEYARNRQAEYPSINDLIVALWENVVEERAASVISLEATRQAIKAKYPK